MRRISRLVDLSRVRRKSFFEISLRVLPFGMAVRIDAFHPVEFAERISKLESAIKSLLQFFRVSVRKDLYYRPTMNERQVGQRAVYVEKGHGPRHAIFHNFQLDVFSPAIRACQIGLDGHPSFFALVAQPVWSL